MARRSFAIALAVAAVGMFSATAAWSQTTAVSSTKQGTAARPELKLATQYSALAGSQRNADSLIVGLRDGKNILLLSSPTGPNPTAPSVTFTPATGKLGYGNINIALSLAKADLAKLGIVNPTPAQLAAVLNGGAITTASGTVTMAGVLAQRQSGMGWGQIAQARGVTLGSLVSGSKTDKAGKKDAPVSTPEQSNAPGGSGQAHSGNQGNSINKGGNGGGSASSGGSHGGSTGGGRSK